AELRAAIESGRGDVDEGRAERTVAAAEDFSDAVRAFLTGTGRQGTLALRAS
ncbi:MAG: hypothetical protein HGA44_07550, partial [Cellulomonadaceae bacterium]|nr:hypothetical protein [Cellulomonadaceae bacterium]